MFTNVISQINSEIYSLLFEARACGEHQVFSDNGTGTDEVVGYMDADYKRPVLDLSVYAE